MMGEEVFLFFFFFSLFGMLVNPLNLISYLYYFVTRLVVGLQGWLK